MAMRGFAVLTLFAFLTGCAHFTEPPPTTMVEVASAPNEVAPLPAPPRAPTADGARPRTSNRKVLLTTGVLLTVVGAALTIGGSVAYVREQQAQREDEARCRANPMDLFCGIGTGFAPIPGAGLLLGLGVPPLGAGLVLIVAGASRHD
jgi:hypothetical protein